MSKPGKSLKALCKKLGVRLTVKRGKKRVYKSVKVLKGQCKRKAGKKKRRRRKFGSSSSDNNKNKRKRSINKSPITKGQNIATVGMEPTEDYDFSYLMTPIRYDISGQRRRKVIPRRSDPDSIKAPAQIIKDAKKDRDEIWRRHGFQDDPQGKYEELLKERLNKRKSPIYLSSSEVRERERADVEARIQRATMELDELPDSYKQQVKRQKRTFGKKKKVSRNKGPSATLKKLCKKLGVRLTVKRGKKRVYKSEKVLKKQCTKKRRRKFGDRTLQRTNPPKSKVMKRTLIDSNNRALRYYRPKIQKAHRRGVPLDIIKGALIVDRFKWILHSRYNPIARKLQRLLDKKKLTDREYEAIQAMYAILYNKQHLL